MKCTLKFNIIFDIKNNNNKFRIILVGLSEIQEFPCVLTFVLKLNIKTLFNI